MFKVFLSSTARDLAEYRQAAASAIDAIDGFHCVRMEDFGARDAVADAFCREKVAECDVVVLLLGLCYGSSPKDSKDSYTLQEYRAAVATGRPCLAFFSEDEAFYPGYYREADALWDRQQAFRREVGAGRVRAEFATPDDLAAKLASALANWAREQGARVSKEPGSGTVVGVEGPGAAAVGPGAVAAGAGGVAVGGDVHGDVHVHGAPRAAVDAGAHGLRTAYLQRILAGCQDLALEGVDPAVTRGGAEARLRLDAVYTALLTRSAREPVTGRAAEQPAEREPLRSALEQLDDHERLVLLGEPGSGKSTFINFVALCLAGEALDDGRVNLALLTAPLPDDEGADREDHQPWSHGALLPVVVVLRDFAAGGLPPPGRKATAQHLTDFVDEGLRAAKLGGFAEPLWQALREHGGLLMLDGLDEVPDAERRRAQVRQAVEDFARSFAPCRILVTSRTYAYQRQDWRLKGFDETLLAPLGDGQVRRFIRHWYAHVAALGRVKENEAPGRAALLERAVFTQAQLREMAERPLLLTLMASLHAWRGGSLPDKREELYADSVELLLDRWERARVVLDEAGKPKVIQPSLAEYLQVGKDSVREVLEALAYEAHARQPKLHGTADIAENDLAGRLMKLAEARSAGVNPLRLREYLCDRAGLLMPRGVGVYTFPHRSFQEYLAACHLTGEDFPEAVARLGRTDPDRWREVLLLAGAKATRGAKAAAWQLADALCFRAPEDVQADAGDRWGAQLAGRLLVESANLATVSDANRSKRERVRAWLLRLMGGDAMPAGERAIAGDSLAALGDPRFSPQHWQLPVDPLLGFVEVPAGKFSMGSDPRRDPSAQDDESPQHALTLPAFFMARWPVTVAQFRAFVEAADYDRVDPDALKGAANHPVVNVSWHGAVAYCQWLDAQLCALAPERLARRSPDDAVAQRLWAALGQGSLHAGLPSEAEWEKAARGTDALRYPWGPDADPECANYRETGISATSAVGCFPKGASPYGCEDMSGNVWEWTRSLWGKDWGNPDFRYPYEVDDGREDLKASDEMLRVLRGGAFHSYRQNVRCAVRYRDYPDDRDNGIGFRVVLSPFFSGR